MEALGSTVKPKRAPRSTRKHQEVLGSTRKPFRTSEKHQEALGRNPEEGKHLEALGSTGKHLEGLGSTRKHLEGLGSTWKG